MAVRAKSPWIKQIKTFSSRTVRLQTIKLHKHLDLIIILNKEQKQN